MAVFVEESAAKRPAWRGRCVFGVGSEPQSERARVLEESEVGRSKDVSRQWTWGDWERLSGGVHLCLPAKWPSGWASVDYFLTLGVGWGGGGWVGFLCGVGGWWGVGESVGGEREEREEEGGERRGGEI